jgi:cell division protein FtsZ
MLLSAKTGEGSMASSIVDDIDLSLASSAKIKVFGVGGGGGNAVQKMIDSGLRGVQFVCANTDVQALSKSGASTKIQLGPKLTKGLGAGANPVIGREAAIESVNAVRDAIGDADMVFVTAGMGGGTGTGAAPVVAQTAKELGVLTIGVVTKPFAFEGAKKQRAAEAGIEDIKQHVDCLITIPNDRLLAFAPKKITFKEMLQKANDVLYYAVKGISDVIMGEGMINLDFADVRTTMSESGLALMGTGMASGENRAREATQRAIMSPLLEDVSLESAKAVLYNISASTDITSEEVKEIGEIIADTAPSDANIIFGVIFDEELGDEIRITVIATGIESPKPVQSAPQPVARVTDFRSIEPEAANADPFARVGRRAFPDGQRQQGSLTSNGADNRLQQWGTEPEDNYQPRATRRTEGQRSWYDRGNDRSGYLRQGNPRPGRRHTPGQEEPVFNDDDWDTPAFLRSQAD